MDSFAFMSKLGQEMALDVCFTCQSMWFDKHESQQLGAKETLELFRLIHSKGQGPGQPWKAKLSCPRCESSLLPTSDLCRAGRFTYFHCPNQHGRFTAFSAFLVEKGFVRQLTGQERVDLAAMIGSVTCSGCGATVDIRKDSVCSYCHAPIVVLDPQALEKALATLDQSASAQHDLDQSVVVDALLLSERQKWLDELQQRTRSAQGGWRNIDDGSLAQGVDLLWHLFQK
ncbi:hypothetical protein [Rhodoferax sp. GW822-FHT02A01]|uniref:hypothetical protein n=1 Tax=Rhodoferax sp. GW822-FHT02A01 TaxID=3141537 RepID=UPI00315CCAFA